MVCIIRLTSGYSDDGNILTDHCFQEFISCHTSWVVFTFIYLTLDCTKMAAIALVALNYWFAFSQLEPFITT
jgi:hypothetical protein